MKKISKQNSHQIDMTIGEPFKLNLIEIFPRSDPFLLSKPRQILEKSCESFLVMDSGQYTTWYLVHLTPAH